MENKIVILGDDETWDYLGSCTVLDLSLKDPDMSVEEYIQEFLEHSVPLNAIVD